MRIIAREGLEAATTRAVAAESGWSTGVLKYYFADKDDLLDHALRELVEVNAELLHEAADQPTGFDQLRSALIKILAGDPDHSRVWIAFLSRAATDARIAKEIKRGADAWQRRWRTLVVKGQQDGSIRADLDPAETATELWALVGGLRMAMLFGTGVDRPVQRDALQLLEGLRPGAEPVLSSSSPETRTQTRK